MKTNSGPPIHHSATPPAQSEIARLAFALLEKLDSGRALPPPSVSKVFRLYCIDGLSTAQVASQCRCSKSAVIRRLKLIRNKTGLPAALLRKSPPPAASLSELIPIPASQHLEPANLFYAIHAENLD